MSIDNIVAQAVSKIQQEQDLKSLDEIRVHYLGKKGELTLLLKDLANVSAEDRPKVGKDINIAKETIQQALAKQLNKLQAELINKKLATETIDVTLQGRLVTKSGKHPITATIDRFCDLFGSIGFTRREGPEVEQEFYNFTALNTPENHPARAMHDTFYLENKMLLRSHTSTVQIRTMQNEQPPLRILSPGKAYRCDSDLTHTPMFHQIEGLMVDNETTFADLKGILADFFQKFFERKLEVRFRSSYFPFTEPSAEVDIACINCSSKGCRVCKNTGWLEVMGSGVVHPKVLQTVGIDPEQYTGFAFGAGVERLAMLYYGIPDIRLNFENDLRYLQQFSN